MNYDDILALVRAGYSKTEIDAMASGAAAPAPVPPAQQPAAPAPVPPAQQPAAPGLPKESPAPAVPPQAQPLARDSGQVMAPSKFSKKM